MTVRCHHGTQVEVEPCYYCDLEQQPPEPTYDDYTVLCEAEGHAFHGEDSAGPRCYCGARREFTADEVDEQKRT